MSISDAITGLINARADLQQSRLELSDAQVDPDGTWGYQLSYLYDAVEKCEQEVDDAEKAVDDAIAMLIQNELGDILAKIKELTK